MGHDEVPTEVPSPDKNIISNFFPKKFLICFSNLEFGIGSQQEKEKDKEEEEKKEKVGLNLKHKKNNFLMCCTNVEFENEEEKEQVLSYLENNTKINRVIVCFGYFVSP